MRIGILTKEFPPHIYGGAGIHVKFLTQELKKLSHIEVRCFGDQNSSEKNLNVKGVTAHDLSASDQMKKIFNPVDINLQMAASLENVDLIHCHTWYSHWAGILSSTMLNVPLVLSTHSLEPHRPWKVEQLGSGYNMSSWIEKHAYSHATGIIAVSEGMRKDVIDLYGIDPSRVEVIYNGIDLDFYQPTFNEKIIAEQGINPDKPFVLFVGRITRQKGIVHLLEAIKQFDPELQVVLCAGAPDTEEIAQEMKEKTEALQKEREGVIWISEMLDHSIIKVLYSHAEIFVCPSMYEPFGIINLEAMACGTPVIGSAVGGIPEIIIDQDTGVLVPLEKKSNVSFDPIIPAEFHKNLANAVNTLHKDPIKLAHMGAASRKRVEDIFSWTSIAEQTNKFYERTIQRYKEEGNRK